MHKLPKQIPIFPLQGVVMFPNTYLPLNIFEPRYLKMIDGALATDDRLIGMIQPMAVKDELHAIFIRWVVLERLLSLKKSKIVDI